MTSKHESQDMASEILRRRYLKKDNSGNVIETVAQMYQRVARHVAGAETRYGATDGEVKAWAQRFCRMMKSGEFVPNSPTLMNAGRENGMLSACYVLPVDDSIEGIFESVKQAALVQKMGGGTGSSFDRLRPTGDLVASSGGKTFGPISFIKVHSEGTSAIQQGAFRRGANMAMMSIDHPDILNFIHAKNDLAASTNFNFSVKVTNDFLNNLATTPNSPHAVINPRTKRTYVIPHSINKRSYSIDDLLPYDQGTADCYTIGEIWHMITKSTWQTGEPGICLIDRVNRDNPTPHLGQIEACNPCGEQPLLPYEACNLGSINVSKFMNKDGKDFHWTRLEATIKRAVRFLDNVIDVNHYPIPEIENITRGNRKIGLGIMGFADTLILLGITPSPRQSTCHLMQRLRMSTRLIGWLTKSDARV